MWTEKKAISGLKVGQQFRKITFYLEANLVVVLSLFQYALVLLDLEIIDTIYLTILFCIKISPR